MAKRKTYQEKLNETFLVLFNEMFKIAGHQVTYKDIKEKNNNEYYEKYTMTEEQYDQWKEFGIKYLMKNLRMSKKTALKEVLFFGLMYSLKIDIPNTDVTEL
jgi:uncharacterized protein YabE (DUF348 family)